LAQFKLTQKANRERAAQVFDLLAKAYPDATCSLTVRAPLELLISTILAAQCTDVRVNQVTIPMFKKYRNAQDYVDAPSAEIQRAIQSCGFFRQKTKSIQKTCQSIVENFGGEVPGTMNELLTLTGVGRKTANVVLGEFFEPEGIVVDTHCMRLSKRLGFAKHEDATKVERDLLKIVPRENWRLFSHYLVFHGRAVCPARAPKCSQCPLAELCPFPQSAQGKKIAK
jgi:endonuclease III